MSAALRVFFSTGEPSGELAALALGEAMSSHVQPIAFSGIGARGMRDAQWELYADHTGWASLGPLAAIPRIPKLLRAMWRCARDLADVKPDLIVLVDFGAFNVRLVAELRDKHRYRGAILYLFPPGAWLDHPRPARFVAARANALTGFAHQAAFYRGLGLPISYFGHPLAPRYRTRHPRPAPPLDAGSIALLPGSRREELRRLLPRLRDALLLLRRTRPHLKARIGASDDAARAYAWKTFDGVANVEVCNGLADAIENVDAAWVASGTAVLESALANVPTVSLYAISPLLAGHARRLMKSRFITIPNLVLNRELVPELLQDDATPQRLADAMEALLRDPERWYRDASGLRDALGMPDALDRCAQYALALAGAG